MNVPKVDLCVVLLSALLCCSDTPTAPRIPAGIADSTILQNLPTIVDLEHGQRPQSPLVRIQGFSDLTGRTNTGGGWDYTFADLSKNQLFTWLVDERGTIRFQGTFSPPSPSFPMTDLMGHLVIDSDTAVRAALRSGGNKFVKKHPDAITQHGCYWLAGRPICEVRFEKVGVGCEPYFYVSTETGEVLFSHVCE